MYISLSLSLSLSLSHSLTHTHPHTRTHAHTRAVNSFGTFELQNVIDQLEVWGPKREIQRCGKKFTINRDQIVSWTIWKTKEATITFVLILVVFVRTFFPLRPHHIFCHRQVVFFSGFFVVVVLFLFCFVLFLLGGGGEQKDRKKKKSLFNRVSPRCIKTFLIPYFWLFCRDRK